MRTSFFSIIFACFVAAIPFSGLVHGDTVEEGFPQAIEADLSAGADAIYRLQFHSAEEHLRHAIQMRPDHPAPHFFMTMLRWYQMTYDSLLRRDPTLDRLFEAQTNLTASVA
ncbi:MAG: hypothetical protein HYS58_02980 [Elusimicrobia bacterium]|nr:hypothetical protein [Elusimicrobiota bacterium]